jgi:sulfoxide reductase catalytic subunit YedY
MEKIRSSEITDEATYLNRRNFIRAGLLAGSAAATAGIYKMFTPDKPPAPPPDAIPDVLVSGRYTVEDPLTSFEDITNYNNYYEFSTSKTSVAARASDLKTRPWTVEVGGMVHKPRIFDIDDLLKFEQEERVYRFRCVEAWSMVIPWVGFPLRSLLDKVEPMGSAAFVSFQTFYPGANPKHLTLPEGDNGMQSSLLAGIDFPYIEGLRMDEAMHPLTLLATGLYGRQMPGQNGAPIRLVVPWKYGFKSIKSIVRITLTDSEPPTTWNIAAPNEYGFYSNVNPNVSHPRWSQAAERRIGELGLRDTLLFNGYAEEVEGMYSSMDLEKYF